MKIKKKKKMIIKYIINFNQMSKKNCKNKNNFIRINNNKLINIMIFKSLIINKVNNLIISKSNNNNKLSKNFFFLILNNIFF